MNGFVQNYFEKPISSRHWFWFQKLFCGALLLQFIVDFNYYVTSLKIKPFYNPIPLLRVLTPMRPELLTYTAALYVLIALLALSLFVKWTKPLLWLILALTFWVMGVALSLDKAVNNDYVFHSKNLVVFVLLILAVAPTNTNKIWPLTLVRLSIGLVYFGSFYTRLLHGGFEWMNGFTLRSILYFHGYLIENPASLWLANQHVLCAMLSVAIVFFEATFILAVLHPVLSIVYAIGGVAFHLGIYYFLSINFLQYHLFAYLIFLVGGYGLTRYYSKLMRKNKLADYSVKRVDFETLKEYWIEVDHFKDPNKVYREHVNQLGHFRCQSDDPKRFCYGLFFENKMIGGTQLVEWAPGRVRYRTINIRTAHRGNSLGMFLLDSALKLDWSEAKQLFGWVRRSHYDWSVKNGFEELDGVWFDEHLAMVKPVFSHFETDIK